MSPVWGLCADARGGRALVNWLSASKNARQVTDLMLPLADALEQGMVQYC
jgi:hypothetical protein